MLVFFLGTCALGMKVTHMNRFVRTGESDVSFKKLFGQLRDKSFVSKNKQCLSSKGEDEKHLYKMLARRCSRGQSTKLLREAFDAFHDTLGKHFTLSRRT